jgi:signal transduction histidine kinase
LIVQGDELRLEQVFQNLIQNALKYSAHDAPVRVTVRQHGATVDVAVRDRGIGIPEASLPHLFDRFYRATNVQDAAVTGMGIGLYVVKEIVELHGGQVGVESVEGQGSTFTVSLPLDTGVSPPGTTHPEQ